MLDAEKTPFIPYGRSGLKLEKSAFGRPEKTTNTIQERFIRQTPILNLALSLIPIQSTVVRIPISTIATQSIRSGPRENASGDTPRRVATYPENPRATAAELRVVSRDMLHPQLHAVNSPNVTEAYVKAPPEMGTSTANSA